MLMTLKNILTVGMPEIMINYMIGLFLCVGGFYKESILKNVLKMICASGLTLSMIILIRNFTQNIIIIALISLICYFLMLKLLWGLNILQSIFSAILIIFITSSNENLLSPISQYWSKYKELFSGSAFIETIPMRITQIIVLYIIWKFNISFSKHIFFRKKWRDLDSDKKRTVKMLLVFMMLGMLFAVNYTSFFINLIKYNIDINGLLVNIMVFFIVTIAYMLITILLVRKVMDNENYQEIKKIINSPIEQMFDYLMKSCTHEQLIRFQDIINCKIKKEGGNHNEA